MNKKKLLIAGVVLYLLISARRRKSATTGGEYTAQKEINLAFAPDDDHDGAIVMTLWKADEPPAILQQFLVMAGDQDTQTDNVDGNQYTAGWDDTRHEYFLTVSSPGDDNTPPEVITMYIDKYGTVTEYV